MGTRAMRETTMPSSPAQQPMMKVSALNTWGDVPLGGPQGPEDADLLRPLQHGDVGDDADHNAGHHQGDGHKGDEHIGDAVDDGGDGGGEHGHVIGVGDLLVLVLVGVVGFDAGGDGVLVLKTVGVDADGGGGVVAHLAEVGHVVLIGGPGHVLVIDLEQQLLVGVPRQVLVQGGGLAGLVQDHGSMAAEGA